ncbi:hypothetical protein PF006_g21959 [Phytophthora fragariae]|uniref:Uncharacterized protein n=1 Tax=Phytophthora fragariae TaxID=53985 RepID=A0A6A3RV71_9STRA|nr:hypothetical protein PF006_g21959 [Phytophthora fragariae]
MVVLAVEDQRGLVGRALLLLQRSVRLMLVSSMRSRWSSRSSSLSSSTGSLSSSRRRPSIVPICLLEKATHLSALRACSEFSAGSSETERCSGGAKGDPHWGSWGCAYFDQASACAEMDLLEEIDAVLALEHKAGLRRRWRDDGEVLAMMPEQAGK